MGDILRPPVDLLRADCAPPPAGLYLHLAAPTLSAPVRGVILTAYPYCYETHWIDPVSGPHRICTIRSGKCPWHHLELRWHAAMEIRLARGQGRRLVRITAHAAASCQSGHFRRPPLPCRGWGIVLSRLPGGRAGRLHVELIRPPAEDTSLAPGGELGPIVAHLYGADRVHMPPGGES